MSTAFNIDISDLKSPSTPRALERVKKLQQDSLTPRTPQQLRESLSHKMDSAQKRHQEHQFQRQEQGRSEVEKALEKSKKIYERELDERKQLLQQLAGTMAMADQNKMLHLEERAAEAGLLVSRAKGIALIHRQEEREEGERLKQTLQESLAKAAEQHEKQLEEVRQRAQKQIEHAMEIHDQQRQLQILESQQKFELLYDALSSAEEKKHEFLEEKATKAGSVYYRAKDVAACMKNIEQIEVRRMSRDLENELRQAQSTKEDLERQKKDRLVKKSLRDEGVRARRLSAGPGSPLIDFSGQVEE
jgi:hypothetical protein